MGKPARILCGFIPTFPRAKKETRKPDTDISAPAIWTTS